MTRFPYNIPQKKGLCLYCSLRRNGPSSNNDGFLILSLSKVGFSIMSFSTLGFHNMSLPVVGIAIILLFFVSS